MATQASARLGCQGIGHLAHILINLNREEQMESTLDGDSLPREETSYMHSMEK